MIEYQPKAFVTEETLEIIRKRQMMLPILLFVTGHRPLAFVVGQLLHLVTPLALFVSQESIEEWAHLLSTPDGAVWLERSLQSDH